jgi:hypothetical protein
LIPAVVSGAVRHRRVTLALWAVLVAAGAVVGLRLELDALPDLTNNQVQVLTRAPGLTPEEVELRVTRPIEVALGGLPGLQHHRSISRYGLSAVTAIFDDDVDPFRARQLVGDRLQIAAGQMPAGVDPPELGPMTGGLGEVYQFTVGSPTRSAASLLELVNQHVVPLLRTVPGIVEVNPWGGEARTLEVRADPVRLAQRASTRPARCPARRSRPGRGRCCCAGRSGRPRPRRWGTPSWGAGPAPRWCGWRTWRRSGRGPARGWARRRRTGGARPCTSWRRCSSARTRAR